MSAINPSSGLSLNALSLSPRKAMLACVAAALASLVGALIAPSYVVVSGTLLACMLVWASAVDLDRFVLPDILTLGLVVAGVGLAVIDGLDVARPRIFGAIAGYAALATLAWSYRRVRRRHGLGLGDAKLLAASGAWLGWAALPAVVLIASLAGLLSIGVIILVRGRHKIDAPIPFGPFIAAGTWIVWLAQMHVLN